MLGVLKFFWDWVRFPLRMGAIVPSGEALSDKIAEATPINGTGTIIELGAGTGVVTKALLKRGLNPQRLICVELGSEMCAILRKDFPNVKIVQRDAYDLKGLLAACGITKVDAIISGLPQLTRKPEDRQKFLQDCLDVLPSGAPFIQYTYRKGSPFPVTNGSIQVKKLGWVWINVPPATVWTYSRAAA